MALVRNLFNNFEFNVILHAYLLFIIIVSFNMEKKWLTFANAAICILIAILLISALVFLIARPSEIAVNTEGAVKRTLPKGAFAQPKEGYEAIGNSIFSLKYSPLTMQLPDLRKYLIYYGKNDRPDAKDAHPLLHFAFVGNKAVTAASPGEKMYILYDRNVTPPQYVFSPGNEGTPLWIQATATDHDATVKVSMKNDQGQIIQEPWSHAQFTLAQKEYVRAGTPWEIEKMRVDGSLLARQKARWYGVDRFLENHGGKEYSQESNKQRIDFGEGEGIYSVFIGMGDGLIWDNNKWKVVKPGVDSLGYPLLIIKKIDDRLMQLELWDVDGQSKMALNLLKSTEPWMPQNVLQNFKFLGSRTRSQFVFEVNKERVLLSPKDWLVLTPGGWKKLSTPEEIDDYVNRKLVGVLFVFDGIERKGDQQYLMGTLYNPSRSESKSVEIPITPSPIGRRKAEGKEKEGGQPLVPGAGIPNMPELNLPSHIPGGSMSPVLPKKYEQEKAMQQSSGYENK